MSSPPMIKADLCVIGAGSAGLSIAAGAAQMGARTVLVEAARMGGDCLNTGCVPSKSLLAVAKVAHTAREAAVYGVNVAPPQIDFPAVQNYVHRVIGAIALHDSVERFTGLGCTVLQARGRFISRRELEVGDRRIHARRFVIATGSRAAVPSIPGLQDVPFFTNETLFDNATLPDHLIIIGAGPIGCEMAQAHRRLGSRVTILDVGLMLPRDDPDAVAVLRAAFGAEGITIVERVKVGRVEARADRLAVAIADERGETWIEGSHILVATGRKPNVEDLGLEAAGIRFNPKGIDVDGRLRTTNHCIYAAGDVVGPYQFTHLASYHAGIVLRNALFRLPAKATAIIPWVTYTDPELAQVGMTEAQARAAHGDKVRILRAEFSDNDRAQAEHATDGLIKLIVGRRGRILGATIVGRQAGETVFPLVLAITQGLRVGTLANVVAPYPTLSELIKRAAGAFYTPTLFSPRTRMLVRLLGWLG